MMNKIKFVKSFKSLENNKKRAGLTINLFVTKKIASIREASDAGPQSGPSYLVYINLATKLLLKFFIF